MISIVNIMKMGELTVSIVRILLFLAFLSASVYSIFMYGQAVFWQIFCDLIFDGSVIKMGVLLGLTWWSCYYINKFV